MLKEYLKSAGLSVYEVAKSAGIPYSTANDLANGRVMVENCKAGDIEKIARYLQIPMEDLMDICRDRKILTVNGEQIPVRFFTRNKSCYAEFEYGGNTYTEYLGVADKINSCFVTDFAGWRIEDIMDQARLEAIMDGLCADEKE